MICFCSKICQGTDKKCWYRKEAQEDDSQHRPQVWQGFSLLGKHMDRNRNQPLDGQYSVCRLLYASSKEETLVALFLSSILKCLDWAVRHTYAHRRQSDTLQAFFFFGQGGGALLTDVFPMMEKLWRYLSSTERRVSGIEASLCRGVCSPPLTFVTNHFTPPTSDDHMQGFRKLGKLYCTWTPHFPLPFASWLYAPNWLVFRDCVNGENRKSYVVPVHYPMVETSLGRKSKQFENITCQP